MYSKFFYTNGAIAGFLREFCEIHMLHSRKFYRMLVNCHSRGHRKPVQIPAHCTLYKEVSTTFAKIQEDAANSTAVTIPVATSYDLSSLSLVVHVAYTKCEFIWMGKTQSFI
jgi:hypothetical protein